MKIELALVNDSLFTLSPSDTVYLDEQPMDARRLPRSIKGVDPRVTWLSWGDVTVAVSAVAYVWPRSTGANERPWVSVDPETGEEVEA